MKADGSYSFDPANEAYDHLNVGDSQVITIPVTVTDDQGATDTSQIQITVTGTNDAPTAISATGGTVEENVGAGTVAAQLSAMDVDDGEGLSYSLISESSLFEIQGDQVVVKNGAQINYESDDEHTLNIQVTDENGASYQQEIQIQVSDINETPTDISLSDSTVDENSAGGTVVATLSATDEDTNESFTYQLSDDSGLFEISGDQVVVKEGADINYEANDAHDITVDVTDSAGNSYTESFTINVNDLVENLGPIAEDDTLVALFTPENARLTAELNFDDGVPSAAVGSLSTETDGQVGNAADFSGAKLSVSGMDLDGADGAQTTVSMWIQGDAEGGWEMLAASDVYDMVMLNGDIGFNTGRGDLFGTDASELSDGEWHHVVGTFTNGDLTQNTIFIDGVEQDMSQIRGSQSTRNTNIDSDSGTMHFGSWGVNDNYRFSGSMDEIKVFNGDLSADEVDELYQIESGNDHWQNGGQDGALEDTALVINPADLLANDTDADGDVLSIVSVEDAEHGSVEINEDGEIVFTPEENYHGEAGFSYTVSDGNGGTDTATVTLNVTSVNDAPVIDIVDNVAVEEGATAIAGQLTSTDADDGASASFSITEGSVPPDGFEINSDGSYSFDPSDEAYDHLNVGDSQVLTIPVTVTDDTGATDTSQIQITVTGTNDAPVASNQEISTEEGTGVVVGQLPATDADDGAQLTFSANGDLPAGFALSADGSYEFDPADSAYDHYGADSEHTQSVSYTVTDEHGESSEGTLYIGVDGQNDAVSLVVDTAPESNTIAENAVNGSPVGLVAHAEDADGDAVSYSIIDSDGLEVSDGPFSVDAQSGIVTVNDASQLDFEDATSHDLIIEASSSDGTSSQQNFSIAVTDVDENIAPDADDDVGRVWVPETNNETVDNLQIGSFDGESVEVSDWGAVIDGSAVYTQGDVTITTSVSDGDLAAYNKAGHVGFGIGNQDNNGLDKSETLIIDIDGGDVNRVDFTLSGLGSWFDETSSRATQVLISAYGQDGDLIETQGGYRDSGSYTDNYSFETNVAVDRFEITSEGSNGTFVVQNMTLTATDSIEVPGHWENVSEDSSITIDVLANDSDVDGDSLIISAVESPVVVDGVVVGAAEIVDVDGVQKILFTPDDSMNAMNDGDSKDVSFNYTVTDEQGGSDTATVNLTIDGSDDAPVVKAVESEVIDGSDSIDNLSPSGTQEKVAEEKVAEEKVAEEIAPEEISIENELMFSMGSQATDDPGMGWAESVDMDEDAFGTANQHGWEDDTGAVDDFDLAASALDLAPDTSGVITMTDGSDIDSMANLQDSANF
jgi:VCBS repeat-containing protein